jgi:hypothetical protein
MTDYRKKSDIQRHDYAFTFNRCKLQFSALLPVVLDRASYTDCKWEFIGPAANTVGLMTALYKAGARDLVEGIFQTIRGEQATSPVSLRH